MKLKLGTGRFLKWLYKGAYILQNRFTVQKTF